jgi:pimeloyl-ACP methyl ester carboxylesterase
MLTPTFLVLLALLADTTESRLVVVSPAESIHVELTGQGPPVVLIPGLFGAAFGFRHVVPLLIRAGYRTIVIEPLAIGRSSRPDGADYSSSAQAVRIAAVLDSLHVRHALVIAHSIAGSEAFRLAYRRPDLVAGVLSLEGGPAETMVTSGFRRAVRFAAAIKLLGGVELIRYQTREQLIDASGDAGWVTDDVVRGYTAGAARDLGGTMKAYCAMSRAREPEPLGPRLAEIRSPVVLLVGTAPHHADVAPEEIEKLRRSLPAFFVDTVPGAGHYLHEERPAAVLDAFHHLRRRVAEVQAALSRP